MKKLINIVIPCYNEEENIEILVDVVEKIMSKNEYDYDLIFVDNGGTDNQLNLMKKNHRKDPKHIKIVSLSRNFGYQMSILAGLEYSKGDAVILMEADFQDPPDLISDFIKKWEEGYDVVYGKRIKRAESKLKRLFFSGFYFLVDLTSEIDIPRNVGSFSLMTRRVVNEIVDMKENIRLFRGLRSWVGFKQIGINYTREKRKFGSTKFNYIESILLAIDGILSFNSRLFLYVIMLGTFCVVLSFIMLGYSTINEFINPTTSNWENVKFLLIINFLNIIIILVGISGSLLERIFIEVKSRSHYFIDEIIE